MGPSRIFTVTKLSLNVKHEEESRFIRFYRPAQSNLLQTSNSPLLVHHSNLEMVKPEDSAFGNRLDQFIEIHKSKGLSDAEIQDLIEPLVKAIRREIAYKMWKILLKLSLILAIIVLAVCCTPLYFHLRAAGRIGLIKINPYWDWNKLYYENCLVDNSMANRDSSLEQTDCTACEDMKGIEVIEKVQAKLLYDNYISQELPVIVSDGALSWNMFHDQHFWFGNISEAYENLYNQTEVDKFSPCHFVTNLRLKNGFRDLFQEIYRHPDKPFFAHWENCHKTNVKALRQFYERPYFISSAVDISFNNWILVSSLYEPSVFRQLELTSNLALLVQIRGLNRFQLTVHQSCSRTCRDVELNLEEGEILVVPTSLWSVKYHPGEKSDNLAFIIQAEMD